MNTMSNYKAAYARSRALKGPRDPEASAAHPGLPSGGQAVVPGGRSVVRRARYVGTQVVDGEDSAKITFVETRLKWQKVVAGWPFTLAATLLLPQRSGWYPGFRVNPIIYLRQFKASLYFPIGPSTVQLKMRCLVFWARDSLFPSHSRTDRPNRVHVNSPPLPMYTPAIEYADRGDRSIFNSVFRPYDDFGVPPTDPIRAEIHPDLELVHSEVFNMSPEEYARDRLLSVNVDMKGLRVAYSDMGDWSSRKSSGVALADGRMLYCMWWMASPQWDGNTIWGEMQPVVKASGQTSGAAQQRVPEVFRSYSSFAITWAEGSSASSSAEYTVVVPSVS